MLSIGTKTDNLRVASDANRVASWPDADAMFAGAWKPDAWRSAKYLARLAISVDARARILAECESNEFAHTLLRNHPRAFYPLMSHLLDRRFAVRERLQATLASMTVVPTAVGARHTVALSNGGITLLKLEDGLRLSLSLSGVSFHEGLWQVGLHSAQGQRLYSLGFGLTSKASLLIANVQGPSLGCDGLELIRQSTHATHGMRPPYLLLHALKALAQAWQMESLVGIDPLHHVKGRWNLRHSRLKFDYRAFWTDHAGALGPHGNWVVPIVTPRRGLDDVPAKRRAMYRRRHALLDHLDEAILTLGS